MGSCFGSSMDHVTAFIEKYYNTTLVYTKLLLTWRNGWREVCIGSGVIGK